MSIVGIIELILAVLLTGAVLLQQKGSGLGAAFGGGGGEVVSTKRGIDKILFQITIVLAVLFFGIALLNVIL